MAVVASDGALVASHSQAWWPRSGGVSSYAVGDYDEDYASIWRTQPNVRMVTSFLARNIAQLALKAYRRLDDDQREHLARHDLARTIRQPNPYVARYDFFEALVLDLCIYDRFLALKLRNPESGALRLFRIPPSMARPIGDNWIHPEAIEVQGSKARPQYPIDAVVYMHGYSPTDPADGVSPLETLRRVLAEERASGEWREQYWRGGSRIAGVIERPVEAPRWSPTARAQFRETWRAAFSGLGGDAGTTPVLEDGMVWKEAAFSPKDSEWLGARVLSRGEVAAQFHVSPLFVGILENANFSNVAEQHKHLYQDTLGPKLTKIEENFELQLVPDFADVDDVYLEFNLQEKLKGSFEEEAQVLQTATGGPWLTRNEARARRNLPRIEGGDQLIVPLNVLVGGQASPRDSAPGAAGRGAPGKAARRPRPTPPAKSVDDLPAPVRGWHAKHLEVLVPFFERQAEAVTARLGAGQSLDSAWNEDRWNRELRDDLAALSLTMAGDVAGDVAATWGGTFDPALAEAWLLENARIAAEGINAATRSAVADALDAGGGSGQRSRAKADDDEDDVDPLELVAGVFAVAASSRAAQIATTRVTSIGNFARKEGAEQAGVRQKVWIVNSSSSRHPGLDGETVPIDATFSNGLLWPGDPSGDSDDTAGCTCSLDFEP